MSLLLDENEQPEADPLIANHDADERADLRASATRQQYCVSACRPRVMARCTAACLALDLVVGNGALSAPFICGELGLLFGAALVVVASGLVAVTSLWILEACARAEGMLRDTEDALGPLLESLLGPMAPGDDDDYDVYDFGTDDVHGRHNRHVPTGAMENGNARGGSSPIQSQRRSQARDARRQGAGRLKGAGLLNNQLSASRVSCFDLSTMCALFGVAGSRGHKLVSMLLCTLLFVLLAAAADVAAASASATICTTASNGGSDGGSTNSSAGGHGNTSFALVAPAIHAECLRSVRPSGFGLFAILVLLLIMPKQLRQQRRHQRQQPGPGRRSASAIALALMRGLTAVRLFLLLLLLVLGMCLIPRGAGRSAARARALLGASAAAAFAKASPPPLWQWDAARTSAATVIGALVLAGSSVVVVAPTLAAAALAGAGAGASTSSHDRSHAVSPSLRAQRSRLAAFHQRRAVLEPMGIALVCGMAVTLILGMLYASAYGGHLGTTSSSSDSLAATRIRSNVLPLLSDSLLQLRPQPLRCAVAVLPFLGSVALAPPLVAELTTAACDGLRGGSGLVLALWAGRRAAGGRRGGGRSVLVTVLAVLAPIALAALLSEPGGCSWPARAGAADGLRVRSSAASGSLGVARLWRCAASAAALVSLTVPAALQLQSVRTSRSAAVASKFRAMVTADMGMDDVHDDAGGDVGDAAIGGEDKDALAGAAADAGVAQLVRLTVQAAAAARKAVPLSALATTAARVRVGGPSLRGRTPTLDRATTPLSGWHSHPLLAFAVGTLGLVLAVWFACGAAADWAQPGAGAGGWLGWGWMTMAG